MNFITPPFGAKVNFLFEKRSKVYTEYSATSIAKEKIAIAQKQLWRLWLRHKAESCGGVL